MRSAAYQDIKDTAVLARDRRVRLLHQVHILYDLLPTTQWIHLAAILVVFGLLFKHVDISLLSSWLGFVLMILLSRIFINNYYKKSVKTLDNSEYWFNWFLVGTTLYGIMWSTTAILLIPAEDPKIAGFTALILAGLAAGGVAVSSVSLKVFVVYAVSTMLPYASFLISSGQNPQSSIGVLLFIFCLLICVVAFHVNSFFSNLIELQLKSRILEKEVKQESQRRRFAEKALLDNTLEEGLADLIRQQSRIIKDRHGVSLSRYGSELQSQDPEQITDQELKMVQYIELLNETLLSNIKSAVVFLGNLDDSALSETQRKNVQIVEKILHDAKSAIEKSFSQLQSGNPETLRAIVSNKVEKINIRRMLIYITHEIPLLYKAKYITIKRRIDKGVPQEIYGNKDAVEQILRQILTNAFKYSDGGEVNVNVEIRSESDDQITLIFRIADSGVGMTREMVEYLMEGEVSDTPDSGIGIIKYLVTRLNGRIAVESTPGLGSTFEITLTFSKGGETTLLPHTSTTSV